MKVSNHPVGNVLGDLRAEADGPMLNSAFLETADYRTLIETSDRTVIVGRRGTGKSALAIKLEQHWKQANSTQVIKLTPEEHQTIAVRPQLGLFGEKFTYIRAASRLAWRYSLMMQTAHALSARTGFSNSDGYRRIKD